MIKEACRSALFLVVFFVAWAFILVSSAGVAAPAPNSKQFAMAEAIYFLKDYHQPYFDGKYSQITAKLIMQAESLEHDTDLPENFKNAELKLIYSLLSEIYAWKLNQPHKGLTYLEKEKKYNNAMISGDASNNANDQYKSAMFSSIMYDLRAAEMLEKSGDLEAAIKKYENARMVLMANIWREDAKQIVFYVGRHILRYLNYRLDGTLIKSGKKPSYVGRFLIDDSLPADLYVSFSARRYSTLPLRQKANKT